MDANDHVWVANSHQTRHFTAEGVLVGGVNTGTTTGLSVDANGKVWAVGGNRYTRIDPVAGPIGIDGATPLGAVDLQGPDLGPGSYLYNYSDMTGSTLSGKPREGTWSAVYDSGVAGNLWGMLDWHAQVLGDGQLTVTVASSDDCTHFSAPVVAISGQALSQVPAGRCLKVSVHFKRASTDESPVLYDLKIRPAVPDLTAGRIVAVDDGVGRYVLQALIGNASPFDADAFDVAFWHGAPNSGGILLGTVRLAGLAAGAYTPVQLGGANVRGVGLGDLVTIHADSNDAYAEYNERNNSISSPLGERNLLASIAVSTDKLVYGPNAPVMLSGLVSNLGSFDSTLFAALQILDANGDEVVRFAPASVGSVGPGGRATRSQPWNTATFPTGTYTLLGQVLDGSGAELGRDSTLFVITASGAQAPVAALTVSTDRALYRPDDRVRIDNLVRNLTPNANVDDARVVISVTAPDGAVVFTTTHNLGQLLAGGLRALDAQQVLRAALPGTYVVTATLTGSGNLGRDRNYSRDVELARASTRYQVASDGGGPVPGPVNNPGENVDYAVVKTALRESVAVGDEIAWQIVVGNAGPHDGEAGGVLVEDVLPAGLADARWTCVATGQAACGAASGTGNIQADAIIYAGDDNHVTFTVQARAQAAGSFDNTAVLTPLGAVQDSNPANDRSTARVTASGKGTEPTGQTADYAIVKTAVTPVVMAPGSVRYRLVVTNRGPGAGGGVAISDLLPPQLANARWSCVASDGARCAADATNVRGEGHVSLPTAQVAPGRSVLVIDIVAEVTTAGVVSNTAVVAAVPGTRDPDAGNDRSTADVEVRSGGGGGDPLPPDTIQPIPVNRPGALLLLIALVALLGSRPARAAWGGRP